MQENVRAFAKDAEPIADGRLLAEAADVSKLEDMQRFFESVDARFGVGSS
jgi:NAD(P)-dependent dehydrogenase (short-subunit alcohol dehydrogenase family)